MTHFKLTCCGASAYVGCPDGTRPEDEPALAFYLARHAEHGMEVVEYEVPRALPLPPRRPKARARGPQRELAL